jgi:hypothetical protein
MGCHIYNFQNGPHKDHPITQGFQILVIIQALNLHDVRRFTLQMLVLAIYIIFLIYSVMAVILDHS